MKAMKHKLVWLAPITLLLVALFPLPYAYYQIMRWVICSCALYIAYQSYQEKEEWNKTAVLFVSIAILYNPIGAIHLFKEAWMVLNILTVGVFAYDWRQNTKRNKKQQL